MRAREFMSMRVFTCGRARACFARALELVTRGCGGCRWVQVGAGGCLCGKTGEACSLLEG